MNAPDSGSARPTGHSLDWWAIIRGTVVGLIAALILLGITTGFAHAFTGFSGSGAENAVSLLALACYFVAGCVAVGASHERALTAGVVAGVAVACIGQLSSFAIWLHRHHSHFLKGPAAEHPGVALLGPLVFGAVFGALGGAYTKRRRARA